MIPNRLGALAPYLMRERSGLFSSRWTEVVGVLREDGRLHPAKLEDVDRAILEAIKSRPIDPAFLTGLKIVSSSFVPEGALFVHPSTLNPPKLDLEGVAAKIAALQTPLAGSRGKG